MALKVQAMKKIGVKMSDNPENMCGHKQEVKLLFDQIPSAVTSVKYCTWKKVELENKMKKAMVVETEVDREDLLTFYRRK